MEIFVKNDKEFKENFTLDAYIHTHMTSDEKNLLYNLAISSGGGTFVEIGSYIGASSCFIAAGIRDSGNGGHLYCVDTWNNDAMTEGSRDTFSEFKINTVKYSSIITALRGDSCSEALKFNVPVDFLFIDGDHSQEGVSSDFSAWAPFLSENAIVVFHDISWSGAGVFVRSMLPDDFYIIDMLPNMWAGRKKGKNNPVVSLDKRGDFIFLSSEAPSASVECMILDCFRKDKFTGAVYAYDGNAHATTHLYESLFENLISRGELLEGFRFIAVPLMTYERIFSKMTFNVFLEQIKHSGMKLVELPAPVGNNSSARYQTPVDDGFLALNCIAKLAEGLSGNGKAIAGKIMACASQENYGDIAKALVYYAGFSSLIRNDLSTCAEFVESYVIKTLRNNLKGQRSIAFFGAGVHSKWLLNLIAANNLKMPDYIIDDAPAQDALLGVKVFSSAYVSSIQKETPELIVISSDNPVLRKLFCDKVSSMFPKTLTLDLYDGMPEGPYPKKGML